MSTIAGVRAVARRGTIRALLITVATVGVATALVGCGGGIGIVVAADVPPPPPPITALGIRLTQTGPTTVQVDWSDDRSVYQFYVERNGYAFANLMATTLVDGSVVPTAQYCYQVSGYSFRGDLLASSDTACIVVAP